MNRKAVLLIFVLFFAQMIIGKSYALAPRYQLTEKILRGLEKVIDISGKQNMRVVVEDVYLEDSRVLTPFGSYLKRTIKALASENKIFTPVQNDKDYSEIENKSFVYAVKTAFDATLLCRYYPEGRAVHIYFTLNKSDSPEILAAYDFFVDKKLIPKNFSLIPDNFNEYKSYQKKPTFKNNDFIVKMWTKRGMNAIYKDGEKLVLNIRSEKDCYIKLYHIDVNGNIQLIFPNPFELNNKIEAGKIYQFPSEKMNFEFQLGKPYGIESIHLIAQEKQFDDLKKLDFSDGFVDIGNIKSIGLQGTLTRGLKIKSKNNKIAETSYIYNIVK